MTVNRRKKSSKSQSPQTYPIWKLWRYFSLVDRRKEVKVKAKTATKRDNFDEIFIREDLRQLKKIRF